MYQNCNKMKSPFVFGKLAVGGQFMDREEETKVLSDLFCNLTNSVIISPRRWGKSSLVRRAGEVAVERNRQLKICYLDVFNVRTEEEFYEKLAAEVVKATSGKWEDIISMAGKYLSALVPVFSVGDGMSQGSLSFTVKPGKKDADEVLDLPQKIAQEKGLDLVICIDEFQQLASFENADALQAKLRSHWQLHQNVAYCLYGSRRHMMRDIFTNPQKPFYKFGQNLFLEKIRREHWPPFIQLKFQETGKSISKEQCLQITALVEDNPYYIQQLSEMVWNRTSTVCPPHAVEEAFMALVDAQAGLNLTLTKTLTLSQQNLLHAIVSGEQRLTSAAVMEKYGLKNSLTVQRAKKALEQLDIIDDFGKVLTMEDPVYAWWLKNVFFR